MPWYGNYALAPSPPMLFLALPLPLPPYPSTHLLYGVQWVRLIVLVVCLVWASMAAVPFIGKTVVERWVHCQAASCSCTLFERRGGTAGQMPG